MAAFATARGKRPVEPAYDSQVESASPSNPSSLSPYQQPSKRQAPTQASNQSSSQDLLGFIDNPVHDLLPIVPTLATTSSSNYGRINAENETNLGLLEGLPSEVSRHRKRILGKMSSTSGITSGKQHHNIAVQSVSNRNIFEHWPADVQVIIHGFEPQIKLHLDKPVLQFHVQERQEAAGFSARPGNNRFAAEKPMSRGNRTDPMFSNFLLTRPLDPETADKKLEADYPYDNVWPPPSIPARHHVSGARSGQAVIELSPDDRPRFRGQVSDQTFRIRQWMQMPGSSSPPSLIGGQTGRFAGTLQVLDGLNDADNATRTTGTVGVHIGEEIITYSTLDPVLYTPTPTKPWRGIWVGDYSGHGCEFLLINQPDDPHVADIDLGLVRDADEMEEAWEKRRREARIYCGRLEAIKLTGDPNVPRGEYTFVADDLGPGGYVGVATDPPFAGARVVKSKGHVAATGFVRGKQKDEALCN
ncbi:hypothetical protein ED733_006952 [Metarhizium rileyi]|uniref:Uncharacterized protein n=1 Tax=Metarhizium rileyi (strain RCEF 4871) TaxID=1649241 RepID=A0A5C6GLI9_METRR|nr:hypothetical protein ED733_006952 [Metarhizium rileyi]